MRDHKDITDYRNLPTIMVPSGMCRKMTADECLIAAEKMEARAQCWLDAKDRRADLKEAAAWRKLAAERREP